MGVRRRSSVRKGFYFASKRLFKLFNVIPKKQVTPYELDGRRVIIVHNPKAAGSSLKKLLGVKGTTHMMPRHGIRKSTWRNVFSIVAVRHPFDRFVSSYSYHVKRGEMTSVAREYGAGFHNLSPFEFLELADDYPEALGPQVMWAEYPGSGKPIADLTLKTEESAGWVAALQGAGLPIEGEVGRQNSSRKAGASAAETLGLREEDVARLEALVFERYREDYAAFGYERAVL